MNIQIYGTNKCFDTKKAQRYFQERRIKFQFIDVVKYGMGPRELEHVAWAVGGADALINPRHPDAKMLSYFAYEGQKLGHLLEQPKLLKTPIVRNGKLATVGFRPEIWQEWV